MGMENNLEVIRKAEYGLNMFKEILTRIKMLEVGAEKMVLRAV